MDKTKSSFRRKEHKARGISYCNASDCTELRTALSRADMAYLHGMPLSTHGLPPTQTPLLSEKAKDLVPEGNPPQEGLPQKLPCFRIFAKRTDFSY